MDTLAEGKRRHRRYFLTLLVGLPSVALITVLLALVVSRLLSRWMSVDVLLAAVVVAGVLGLVSVVILAVHQNLRCPGCERLNLAIAHTHVRPFQCHRCEAPLP
jgi:hypothetical protein